MNAPLVSVADQREQSSLKYLTIQARARIFISLIRWSAIVVLGTFAWLSVHDLAGKATSADIKVALGILANIEVSKWAAWAVAGAGVTFGARADRLRKKTIERLGARNTMLERKIDATRTGSMLTTTGETDPLIDF